MMMARVASSIAVGVFWLLHWLPLGVQARIGGAVGELLYRFAGRRRHIVNVNLRLCFPAMAEAERARIARAHFHALGRSMLERGLLWWASEERLKGLIRLEGREHVDALIAAGRPILLLAPHFLGLDIGGARFAMEFDSVSVYARQNNPVFDRWLFHGRSRFGNQLLLSRQDGVRGTVKAMKAGRPFYYLPDMDYGREDSIFVPFFGVPAATITGLSRLSRLARAAVVPVVTVMLPGGKGYVTRLGEPWADFPTTDVEADTLRMNQWIESVVRTMPEQYYWVHRRFKTRPPGEKRPY